jgi:hypothetical protein
MAFADSTGSRDILGIGVPVPLTVKTGVTVKAGDLLGYSSGWALADANAGIPAEYIAGTDGEAGQEITAYKEALVGGFTGGTAGGALYLSDTAGGYSDSASTTSAQRVGTLVSATQAHVRVADLAEWEISHNFASAGATAGDIFHTATRREKVTVISEVHATAAGQAGTITVERLQGTEAPGSGDDLLGTTKIDAAGTINTVQTATLTSTTTNLVLEVGNRLALKVASGATTTLANACVTVHLQQA